ncbi:MAG: T9SS type A sorting domain-containing protein, partial [Muribaculaceae bacterium]|nr:T9SS type A sorting domain-containing protein [Muribaculaceae bacterium]
AYLYGAASTLEVFDFSGSKLLSLDVEGRNNVSLPLASGLYIVRVADAAGNYTTVKAFIK